MAAITILLYVVTAINVLVSAGFAIAGVTRPAIVVAGASTEPSRVFALFAAARAAPLAIVTLFAIAIGALTAVEWLGALAGIIQLADAWIGFRLHNRRQTFGPLVLGIVQLALLLLLRQSGTG